MKEIGGYIELDRYTLPMLHENAKALNCGRNCLAYLIRARGIKKIALPYFLCDSVKKVCQKEGVQIRSYNINTQFVPESLELQEDEWLYIVNFYGQLNYEQTEFFFRKYKRLIVDSAQAYFEQPLKDTDTIYTCRKFFGVPDGAFLYTDAELSDELTRDESFERMRFLLGRYERNASEFYEQYNLNNKMFADEPIKKMSKLTENLLHGIDYDFVKNRRTENYNFLFDSLSDTNRLKLKRIKGAFAYPLWIKNGAEIRRRLLEYKIYIPTLWPNVLNDAQEDILEYDMAENILPIPCDQRYSEKDMQYIIEVLLELYKNSYRLKS